MIIIIIIITEKENEYVYIHLSNVRSFVCSYCICSIFDRKRERKKEKGRVVTFSLLFWSHFSWLMFKNFLFLFFFYIHACIYLHSIDCWFEGKNTVKKKKKKKSLSIDGQPMLTFAYG